MKHIWAPRLPIKCSLYPIGPPSDIIIPSSAGVIRWAFRCPHPPADIGPPPLFFCESALTLAHILQHICAILDNRRVITGHVKPCFVRRFRFQFGPRRR